MNLLKEEKVITDLLLQHFLPKFTKLGTKKEMYMICVRMVGIGN